MTIQAIYLGAVICAFAVFAITLAYASIWTRLDPLAKSARPAAQVGAAPARGRTVDA